MSNRKLERILKILKSVPIRYIDGRYTKGFVDQEDLDILISNKNIEIFINQGMKFVKLK
jgi:hypothetical protein